MEVRTLIKEKLSIQDVYVNHHRLANKLSARESLNILEMHFVLLETKLKGGGEEVKGI